MKIIFHSNSLSERGTSVAIYEYMTHLQAYHEVAVTYDLTNLTNHEETINLFASKFEVIPYRNFRKSAARDMKSFDFGYAIKSGENDGILFPHIPTLVHVVFQKYDPHGYRYAYVSEWLAKIMQERQAQLFRNRLKFLQKEKPSYAFDFVPHIVNLPSPDTNVRKNFKIPEDALLGLRYGGYDSFDLKIAHDAVKRTLVENPMAWFLMVNTKKFYDHPRLIYTKAVVSKQTKSNLLGSADFFIHGRKRGETFGLAIIEAMQMGTPVFAWYGGIDQNHIQVLKRSSLYQSSADLCSKIHELKNYSDIAHNVLKAKDFSPDIVMQKFNSIFIDPTINYIQRTEASN